MKDIYQLRVTAKEYTALRYIIMKNRKFRIFKLGEEPTVWTSEDEALNKAVKVLAPDLIERIGRMPVQFDIVIVKPAWLIKTGEVQRWVSGPAPDKDRVDV